MPQKCPVMGFVEKVVGPLLDEVELEVINPAGAYAKRLMEAARESKFPQNILAGKYGPPIAIGGTYNT